MNTRLHHGQPVRQSDGERVITRPRRFEVNVHEAAAWLKEQLIGIIYIMIP
jgi:hypothetical protein